MKRLGIVLVSFAILISNCTLAAADQRSRQARLDDVTNQIDALNDLNRQLTHEKVYRNGAIVVTVAASATAVLSTLRGFLKPLQNMFSFSDQNSKTEFLVAGAATAVDAAAITTWIVKEKDIANLREQVGIAKGSLEAAKRSLVEAAE